jgi:hypothetical protein
MDLLWDFFQARVIITADPLPILKQDFVSLPVQVSIAYDGQYAECQIVSSDDYRIRRGTSVNAVVAVLHVSRWAKGLPLGALLRLCRGSYVVGEVVLNKNVGQPSKIPEFKA